MKCEKYPNKCLFHSSGHLLLESFYQKERVNDLKPHQLQKSLAICKVLIGNYIWLSTAEQFYASNDSKFEQLVTALIFKNVHQRQDIWLHEDQSHIWLTKYNNTTNNIPELKAFIVKIKGIWGIILLKLFFKRHCKISRI